MQALTDKLSAGRAHEIYGPAARVMAALASAGERCLWIVRERNDPLCPQGLSDILDVSKLLLVEADGALQSLWCAEQALRAGAAGTVIVELDAPTDLTVSRRLQLAAKESGRRGLCLVPHGTANNAMETRWQAEPLPSVQGRARMCWRCVKNKKGINYKMFVERGLHGWQEIEALPANDADVVAA